MHRWSGHRALQVSHGHAIRWPRTGAGLAACTLAAVLTITGASGALASAPAWKLQASLNATVPGGQLESVSCSSATACTAVGSNLNPAGIHVTLAERWNGTTWQHQQTPNPATDTNPGVQPDLTGVSCPAAGFCAAVGVYTLGEFNQAALAYGWNGHRWAMQRFPVPAGASSTVLRQVACASAQFCEAVGSYQTQISNQTLPLAATWNGTSWRLQHAPHPAGDSSVQLNVVSCTSTAFCEAWGGPDPAVGNGADLAEQWNGRSWHLQAVPPDSTARSVSCVSPADCEAVGFGAGEAGSAWRWNGSSWKAQKVPSQITSGSLGGVSCVSPAFCEAVGFDLSGPSGLAAVWNGSAWKVQPTPNPAKTASTSLNAVSCTSASSCELAGSFELGQSNIPLPLAEAWNGSTWVLQAAAAPPGAAGNALSAVSCVSASFCEAVGSHGNRMGVGANLAETWNGSTWKNQPTPSPQGQFGPTSNDLEGVSCVSTSFCEAVGNGPNGMSAELWNGTSWTVQNRPGSGGVQGQSVSCPSTGFCMSSDAFGRVDTWNGSSWSAGTDVPGFSKVGSLSCVSASFCEVVGFGPSGENAAVWNGSTWTAQPTAGGTSEDLISVSCRTATSCEAVGELFNEGSPLTLAETWNGSTWAVQPTPAPSGAVSSTLNSVSCAAANACTAVGDTQPSSTVPLHTLAEVWDGTTWSLRSTPNRGVQQNILNAVSCGASLMCTAVGQAQNANQVEITLAESGD
ncbi:MAG TPA: hypothetical protein VGI74_25495 [Streptosporangiaceae bacterium]